MLRPGLNLCKLAWTCLETGTLQTHHMTQIINRSFRLQRQIGCKSKTAVQKARLKLNKMLPPSKQDGGKKPAPPPSPPPPQQPVKIRREETR